MGIQCIQAIDPCGGRQDIFELKRLYGERVALHGNIDCQLLTSGTPDNVRAATEEQVRILSAGGRLHLLVQPRSERTHAHGEYPGDDRDDPWRQSPDRRPTMSSPRIRVMERCLVAGDEVARRDSLFHTLWVYDIGGSEDLPVHRTDGLGGAVVRRGLYDAGLKSPSGRRSFGGAWVAREASMGWTDW